MPGVAGRGPGPWGGGTCGGGGGWLVLGLRTAVKRSSTSLPSSSVTECNSTMLCVHIRCELVSAFIINHNKIPDG